MIREYRLRVFGRKITSILLVSGVFNVVRLAAKMELIGVLLAFAAPFDSCDPSHRASGARRPEGS